MSVLIVIKQWSSNQDVTKEIVIAIHFSESLLCRSAASSRGASVSSAADVKSSP